jgi:quercetin dioxygenase-like cupin family protein
MAYVSHIDEIEAAPVEMAGAEGVLRRMAVGPEQGWEDYAMRVFTLTPGGHTPRHRHGWPHINYVISGKGVLSIGGEAKEIRGGSVAYVPDDVEHQFRNAAEEDLVFICIVPRRGEPAYARA